MPLLEIVCLLYMIFCLLEMYEWHSRRTFIINNIRKDKELFNGMNHMLMILFQDQYILKMHVKLVHMPAEVLFECTVCAKKFTRKAHLKRHLRIHAPDKPFKCPHCDYRCATCTCIYIYSVLGAQFSMYLTCNAVGCPDMLSLSNARTAITGV